MIKKANSLFIFILISQLVYAQKLVRGPYLQMATSSSICVKIHLDTVLKAQIRYGETVDKLTDSLKSLKDTLDHDFKIKNLKPLKKYFYKIYVADKLLFGDSTSFFITNPNIGSAPAMQFVVLGDCGSGNSAQKEVLATAQKYFKGKDINGLILLGDNAYNDGLLNEYQKNFFDIFDKKVLHNVALWPSPGNHEYGDKRPLFPELLKRPAYYSLFDTPTKGEAGGVPSGDESYYAFEMGNVHFISLDSFGYQEGLGLADSMSKQYQWLEADLKQNIAQWTIVFFHHPPFSKGSHDSDKEDWLIKLRQVTVKLLDKYNVDVVLNGHSHNYERSFLMRGHYGLEASFDTLKHSISTSSARFDGTVNSCPIINKNQGTIYNVSGSSSRWGFVSGGYPHNAMVYSNSEEPGASLIEVNGNRLDLKFINIKGDILDKYTLFKNVGKKYELLANCGDEISLNPSFTAAYTFPKDLTVNANLRVDSVYKNLEFTYSDQYKCITDSVKVSVAAYPKVKANVSVNELLEGTSISFNSTGGDAKGKLEWQGPQKNKIESGAFTIDKVTLADAGIYRLVSKYKKCISTDSVEIKVLKILGTEPNYSQAEIFPNPSQNSIKIRIDLPESGTIAYRIMDINGKVVQRSEPVFKYLGEQEILLNTKNLPVGKYLLQFDSQGFKKVFKFVKN
jgi:acid phosphatase type 7